MIIDRDIKKYIIFREDRIHRALEKIDANDMRVIFVVDEFGVLEGIVTDGDFRRWIIGKSEVNLNQPISILANTDFSYCHENTGADAIKRFFSRRIEYVPLVDDRMRLVAVASKRHPALIVGKHEISKDSPTFIIAEIGNNHNGSFELACQLVDEAVKAGADCAKFQKRNMAELYRNKGKVNDTSEDLGSQYILDLLDRFQLRDEEFVKIFDYCRENDILPLCTPWDFSSVDFLKRYGVAAFKVASADFTNHELLKRIAVTGKPMFCSTGMCSENEVQAGVDLLKRLGTQFTLLHCNSTYPTPFKDINLNYLKRLQDISGYPVGYSGHERGIHIPVAAVAMGAKVIEKHLTLDRSMEGSDHKISLLPSEFKKMVEGIRQVDDALGTDGDRTISQGELINRENLAKSLTINCDLKKGETITETMIVVKSPGKGLPPYRKNDLIGRPAPRDYTAGSFFYEEDLGKEKVVPHDYIFGHPFGVPVRYHDVHAIMSLCKMDLLEIHLSYKDLEEKIDHYFDAPLSLQLVVHSPELFAGDHILDLCTHDEAYRNHSIAELQRVIDITNELKHYFPRCEQPLIIINAGGFSSDDFLPKTKRLALYANLKNSLNALNQDGIEIIPQTMPPFPWHFGGQRYHNLFLEPEEIFSFCNENHYRICLDISHSMLACNYLKISFTHYLKMVAPVTAHMHIADAKGVDGEGLQIGEGEIEFVSLMQALKDEIPNASFIPEIWQGHKNNGQGFWVALNRLEKAANKERLS